jgi:hypothetical protein
MKDPLLHRGSLCLALSLALASTSHRVEAADLSPQLLLSTGSQQFQLTLETGDLAPWQFQGDSKSWRWLLAADIDNDQVPEQLIENRRDGSLMWVPDDKLSPLKPSVLPIKRPEGASLFAADVNGDGAADLVIKMPREGRFDVLLSAETNARPHTWFASKSPIDALVPAQIDGDTKADLVALNAKSAALYLSATRAARHTEPSSLYSFEITWESDASLQSPRLQDMNADGRAEVVFATDNGELAPYQFFAGADGYLGLTPYSLPAGGKSEQPLGSWDIDQDGLAEWLTWDRNGWIMAYSHTEGEASDKSEQEPLAGWKLLTRFALPRLNETVTQIDLLPIRDLVFVLSKPVGVDQLNEFVNPFIVTTPLSSLSEAVAGVRLTGESLALGSQLSVKPALTAVATPQTLRLSTHYRADFGVDVLAPTFAFSADASVTPTSAQFQQLVPDANGILRPTGPTLAATIVGQRISASLPQGQYRLRVINQASTAEIVTLNRFVPVSLQLDLSRLYPYVEDPVARPAKDHYLSRKLSAVTDGDAYYDQVAFFKATADAEGRPATFDDWFQFNAIASRKVMNAVYVNATDLGFARNMFITQKDATGRVFAWVENYATLPEAVAASQSYKAFYNTFVPSPVAVIGDISLTPVLSKKLPYISLIDARVSDLINPAVIADLLNPKAVNRQGLIATVVMEYHPDAAGNRLVSFFVFNDSNQLSTAANLDGRGAKLNPGVCMACHGGTSLANNGDVGAGFIPWDLDSYVYSSHSDYTRTAQLASFWGMNRVVKSLYPSSDPVNQLVTDWYPFVFPLYKQKHFVGNAVMPASFAAAGKESLYREVTATSCRMCHVQPGVFNALAEDESTFSAMLGFKLEHTPNKTDDNRYAPDMPQAYLTFKNLWSRGHMDAVKAEIGH